MIRRARSRSRTLLDFFTVPDAKRLKYSKQTTPSESASMDMKTLFQRKREQQFMERQKLNINNTQKYASNILSTLTESVLNQTDLCCADIVKFFKPSSEESSLLLKMKKDMQLDKKDTLKEFLLDITRQRRIAKAYSKSVSRQSFDETFQLHFLKECMGKTGIVQMNKIGSDARFFRESDTGQVLLVDKQNASKTKCSKSFDFRHGDEYYFAKYATCKGSAQNHNMQDGVHFLKLANKYVSQHPTTQKRFILLVDGAFYNQSVKKNLRSHISVSQVYVLSSWEVDTIPQQL